MIDSPLDDALPYMTAIIAEGGNVEVMRWAKNLVGAPWDNDEICQYAALLGHLDMVKYLIQDGGDILQAQMRPPTTTKPRKTESQNVAPGPA